MKRLRIYLLFFLCIKGPSAFCQEVDAATFYKIIYSKANDTTISNAWIQLADFYMYTNPDSVENVCQQVVSFTDTHIKKASEKEKKVLQSNKAEAIFNLARMLQRKGEITKSIEMYKKSLELAKACDDMVGVSYILIRMGGIFSEQGNTPKAIDYLNRSIANSKKIKQIDGSLGDKEAIASAFGVMGNAYEKMDETKQAVNCYEKSLELYKQTENKPGTAGAYNNLGSAYIDTKEYGRALEMFSKALALCREIKYKIGEGSTINNIGYLYMKMEDYKKAETYYLESLAILQDAGDVKGESSALKNLGTIYFKYKNYDRAIAYGKKAMKLAKEQDYPESIMDMAGLLRDIYHAQGNSDQALQMYRVYIENRDKVNSEENRKAGIRQELKLEYEKKAAADSIQHAEQKRVSNARFQQQRTRRSFIYTGIVLVMFFAAIMYILFRITKRRKLLLEEQKTKIEHQKQVVDLKQKEIMDSIRYAQRIQRALLPSEKYISKNIPG